MALSTATFDSFIAIPLNRKRILPAVRILKNGQRRTNPIRKSDRPTKAN
jgi:hypothetical protein